MRNTLASPLPNPNQPPQDYGQMKTKKKKSKRTLPWWCIFIAYGFSFLIFAISAFFIFARGVEFGDVKVGQWLTSSVAGFFSSVFLTQPVKVNHQNQFAFLSVPIDFVLLLLLYSGHFLSNFLCFDYSS